MISRAHAKKCLQILRTGAELTIQLSAKRAIIDMFGSNEFEMKYELAKAYEELGLLVCTGGNLELKERHFYLIK
ncbi:hypothetical protein ORI89_19155 [Sphingobacterium sp. UT-1RO-CII-1]|uniref:hypothetical protein n=1 Tax=Sphingobacterium sp. UT-1RO-CII-1 TaxID=2995225 RepID=UPI00227B8E27|nr:hypothetical protein [Sphingobacterium sp. UT-1RO-CII-1]MCY4781773.1 hypothetical protein [Sphingobacterium sp. UT-1RO-CII-1]